MMDNKELYADIQNNVKIWHQTFGLPNNPPFILLMGNGAQGIFWPDLFCQKLAERNYYVVRFDYRDTGLSSHFDFDKYSYDFLDIAKDILGFLNALKLEKAHFVGLSIGGFIAQLLAIHYPEHVLSVVSMMSTSDYSSLLSTLEGRPFSPSGLPAPKKEFMDTLAKIDPSLTEIEKLMANWKAANGSKASFDEKDWYELLKFSIEREKHSGGIGGGHNHMRAAGRMPDLNLLPSLRKVAIPFLAIQGGEDPIFTPEHGRETASSVPNGKLLMIENMGHAFAPEFYGLIINAIRPSA